MVPELVASWRFAYEHLAGYIAGGHAHGIELTVGADSKPVTRPECLNLEHYFARSCTDGLFVPRLKAEIDTQQIGTSAVQVSIAPYGNWQIHTTITYRVLPNYTIAASYDFAFDADYIGFEAFVSNYFHTPTEPYLYLADRWVQPSIAEDEHRFWVRDPKEADNAQALYPTAFEQVQMTAPIDPLPYRYPIMITPIADSGWSVITLVDAAVCPNLSINRRWNAHDFCLIGHDVRRGQIISCQAWLVYAKLASLDDALPLYQHLTRIKPDVT